MINEYRSMKERIKHCIRIVWFVIYVILTFLTLGFIITLRHEFISKPIVTTLETAYYPVNKIPFPGIAVCNLNKISRKQATLFAQYLGENTNITTEEVLESIRVFGKLHDFDYNSTDDAKIAKMQQILETLKLNLIEIMKELTSKCDKLISRCRWKGIKSNCSEIFQMQVTYDGVCCTFNYFEKTTSYDGNQSDLPFEGEAGISKGLSLWIKNELEDYLYAPLSSQGVTVQVFIPTDYPDKPSGSLSEVVAKVNDEIFIQVVPTTVKTETGVGRYPLSTRQCLFDEERETKFQGVYSQSDCNVDCKISSTLALCECIPFTVPLSTKDTVCTLNNLACLSRHKNKWNSYYPEDDDFGLLQHEQHDSLRCKHKCYPSCDGTSYEIYSDGAPNHPTKTKNGTIIHVYYANRFSKLYKQDVVYYWFEMLSNYGGTFGLVIGLSLASIIEFCIFCFQIVKRKYYLKI